jgi:hypothetical protein
LWSGVHPLTIIAFVIAQRLIPARLPVFTFVLDPRPSAQVRGKLLAVPTADFSSPPSPHYAVIPTNKGFRRIIPLGYPKRDVGSTNDSGGTSQAGYFAQAGKGGAKQAGAAVVALAII